MPTLHAHVKYSVGVHGWEPEGLALVELTQDNALLDASVSPW